MSGVSYFGVTIVQPDLTIAVDGDDRFDPLLRYRENVDGDFEPVGPRIDLSTARSADLLRALGGGENVPVKICERCAQKIALYGDGKHRCARVLKKQA